MMKASLNYVSDKSGNIKVADLDVVILNKTDDIVLASVDVDMSGSVWGIGGGCDELNIIYKETVYDDTKEGKVYNIVFENPDDKWDIFMANFSKRVIYMTIIKRDLWEREAEKP